MAKRDGVSLSLKARDLLKSALEIEKDIVLVRFTEERERSSDREKALTHPQAWEHLGGRGGEWLVPSPTISKGSQTSRSLGPGGDQPTA